MGERVMKGRWRIGGMAFVCAAGLLAQSARALPTLIFVDDFSTEPVFDSTPAPGSGGGVVGGEGFWTQANAEWGAHGTNYLDNGSLRFDYWTTGAGAGVTVLLSDQWHSQFNFLSYASGQGLLAEVRGLEMEWGEDGLGRLHFGIHDGPGYGGGTNAFMVSFYAFDRLDARSNGVVALQRKGSGVANEVVQLWETAGTERPTGADLYLDSVNYGLTVYYSDGSTRSTNLAHGLDAAAGTNAMKINFAFRGGEQETLASGSVGGLTITQIPEPGSISLALGALGVAWFARRIRRRG